MNGDTLFLSDGGMAVLPVNIDNDSTNEIQMLTKSGDTLILSNGGSIVLASNIDNDTVNEIQFLTFANDSIFLSNGGGAVAVNSLWTENGANIYRMSNVGINKSNPVFTLHVLDTLAGGNDLAALVKVQGGSTSGGTYIGIAGEITGTDGSNRGVYGHSNGVSNGQNVGTFGEASGSSLFNVGALGKTTGNAPQSAGMYGFNESTGADNYGVLGNASGFGIRNYGLIGYSSGGTTDYGVYGWTDNVGINYAGFFEGDVNVTNNLTVESKLGVNTTSPSFTMHVLDTLSGSNDLGSLVKVQGGSTSGGTFIGFVGEIENGTNGSNRGVFGWSHGISSGQNVGMYGLSSNSTVFNIGSLGHGSGNAPEAAGVYGFSDATGLDNYGISGNSSGAGTRNYGLIGYAANGTTDYGVYGWTDATGTNYAGFFEGRVNVTQSLKVQGIGATGSSEFALHVLDNLTGTNDLGGLVKVQGGSTSGGTYIGIVGEIENGTDGSNRGVFGWSHGNSSGQNVGVYGLSSNSSIFNVGTLGHVEGTASEAAGVYGFSDASGLDNYGVSGNSSGAGTRNYGLIGFADNGATDYGVYGWTGTAGTGTKYGGYFEGDVVITGNLSVTGSLAKGSGTFKIDHPLDPENKYLVHSFVESPDMMNIYNGNIITDANGFATVKMPEYFEAANKEFRYQLTVIGTFSQAIIKEKMDGNTFVIQTNQPNVEVSWQVTGVRADKFANENRVIVEEEKSAEDKGTYLHPALYGASEDRSENQKHRLNAPKNPENSVPNTATESTEGSKESTQKVKVPATPVGGANVNTSGEESK